MRTLLLSLVAVLAVGAPAHAARVVSVKKKQARHQVDKRRLGDPRGAFEQFQRARGLLKKSGKR